MPEVGTETWHYGLIAKWWAEFNWDGEDIAYHQALIEHSGEPALDLGCGTGRLLIPFLRAGLDVDGCDVSADMLAHCKERAAEYGLSPRLYHQAMHELSLPRRYRTIIVCGSFGLGGDRHADLEGLRRIHAHLEPGGLLAFEIYLPTAHEGAWRSWLPSSRPELPRPWPERGDRRRASDGSEYELRSRVVAFDPLEQVLTRELRVEHTRDGELLAREDRALSTSIYFKNEVLLLLESAGFGSVEVKGGLTDRDAKAYDDAMLMFLATR
jgi:SAM-dependent methyltransferase